MMSNLPWEAGGEANTLGFYEPEASRGVARRGFRSRGEVTQTLASPPPHGGFHPFLDCGTARTILGLKFAPIKARI